MSNAAELTIQNDRLLRGDPITAADAAEKLAQLGDKPSPEWVIIVYDKFWEPLGEIGDYIECTGSDPRNNLPSATLKLKGNDPLGPALMDCRRTMVGVTIETGGIRMAFYVDTCEYVFENSEWTYTANLVGIWDVLNYLQIWPNFLLPIQAQIPGHAIFIGPIITCIEVMIIEQAFRIQTGWMEFVNNLLSFNLDFRTWFGTFLMPGFAFNEMLKCPIYVSRVQNPLFDTSPLICRPVRMESCGSVIRDITRAYGIDVRVDLWLPGDPQPDQWTETLPWMQLDRPTYVVSVADRTQITGPTGTILDSILRTIVDLEGSLLGHLLDPILNPRGNPPGLPEGFFIAPTLGVNWTPPWVLLVAPEPGDVGSIETCKIVSHTPKGWKHIIGGRSPRWLNDLFNIFFAWIIDAIMILVGFVGVPSDLLSGFLNNVFFAFQEWDQFERRYDVGPYHPAVETFTATASAPYNIETVFGFINKFFDTRGWTCIQATFRNGEVYSLNRDIFRGQLVSVAFYGRTQLYTDYIDNVAWRIDKTTRDVMLQIGDGKAIEAPLAKHQRNITGLLEAINTITLAPESSAI